MNSNSTTRAKSLPDRFKVVWQRPLNQTRLGGVGEHTDTNFQATPGSDNSKPLTYTTNLTPPQLSQRLAFTVYNVIVEY